MAAKYKVIYLSMPLSGDRYWAKFEEAEDALTAKGYTVLNPARLPEGLPVDKQTRVCFAMIDCADAVLCAPGSKDGIDNTFVDYAYCVRTGKPRYYSISALMLEIGGEL